MNYEQLVVNDLAHVASLAMFNLILMVIVLALMVMLWMRSGD